MISVFEGGEGCESAGISERSNDMLGEWRRLAGEEEETGRETGGVEISVAMSCIGAATSGVSL